MNALKTFTYENREVRTVEINGEPWWVANDVCEVFGETNRNRIMQTLDEDEKGYTQMTTPGGVQKLAIINESGLYSMLFAMHPSMARGVSDEYIAERQDKLKDFKRWVTRDVLPSIRKHGIYATDELLQELREVKTALNAQQQQIAEMGAKSGYYDVILNTKDLISVTAIAKDYGKSATWLNKKLHEWGVQYKLDDTWFLYQKYAEKGYTHSKTYNYPGSNGELHSKMSSQWTQKGRLFIYDLLKSHGYLPLMEQEMEEQEQLTLCE